jgi:hypothetical protein
MSNGQRSIWPPLNAACGPIETRGTREGGLVRHDVRVIDDEALRKLGQRLIEVDGVVGVLLRVAHGRGRPKRSALLDGDWVSGLIVSGRVWALGWWFDTSALAADPTVERVLAEADQRVRVPRTRQ